VCNKAVFRLRFFPVYSEATNMHMSALRPPRSHDLVHGYLSRLFPPPFFTPTKVMEYHQIPSHYLAMLYLDSSESLHNELLPSYRESKRSPRCTEDISNPAPSYDAALRPPMIPDGADQLFSWISTETRKMLSRRSERRHRRS